LVAKERRVKLIQHVREAALKSPGKERKPGRFRGRIIGVPKDLGEKRNRKAHQGCVSRKSQPGLRPLKKGGRGLNMGVNQRRRVKEFSGEEGQKRERFY